MAEHQVDWKGIDRGREYWLQPDHWMEVLKVLSENEGESIRDPKNALYAKLYDLERETSWISQADPSHNFFRDYQTAWTLTGVLRPTIETKGKILLTELGRMLANGIVSQRAVMIQAMALHQEEPSGDCSYAILAQAFLQIGIQTLNLEQVYHSIAVAWRPGDGQIEVIPESKCSKIPDVTKRRRLRSILSLMSLYGCLKNEGTYWSQGDNQLLEAVSQGPKFPIPIWRDEGHKLINGLEVSSGVDEDVEKALASVKCSKGNTYVRRVLREIAARRGQGAFRKQLLQLYCQRCAVTQWDSQATLEAAHIVPVADDGTNDVTNGILLRSDVHTLFDLNCLAIDPECWQTVLSPSIQNTKYADLHGRKVILPASLADYPNRNKLYHHMQHLR